MKEIERLRLARERAADARCIDTGNGEFFELLEQEDSMLLAVDRLAAATACGNYYKHVLIYKGGYFSTITCRRFEDRT